MAVDSAAMGTNNVRYGGGHLEAGTMARDGGIVPPGVAARELGIASSTLRIYSTKLAALLSASAGRPRPLPDGRPGVRTYTAADIRLLKRAKELLGSGLTYDQVASELAGPSASTDAARRTNGGRRSRQSATVLTDFTALLAPLQVALEQANAATAAWQRLAEEREREVLDLRGRIAALEGETEEQKISWWRRLFRGA